ncbi:hypothetical protein QAD02_020745 [Eretmocerus hayati]|uniref:Uncharacterized protein n=1 Tax=Eretmocerus hayati TaxID=131215 RepID=A0ACC2PNG4_9HYME|nr:hypothetical protein QAD02_020745 [Eretmocerus hayati]
MPTTFSKSLQLSDCKPQLRILELYDHILQQVKDFVRYLRNRKALMYDVIIDPLPIEYDVRTAGQLVNTHEIFVDHIATGKVYPVYGMNLELLGVQSMLHDFPLYIDPKVNKHVGRMVGINVPTFYMGSRFLWTPFHIEDRGLDSVNIVHYCVGRYAKVWQFISSDDYPRAREAFGEDTITLCKHEQQPKNFLLECSQPEQHKAFLRSVSHVEKSGIKSQLVVQGSGDIIYVAPDIPHQVLNLEANLAEAVNVGSVSRLAGYKMFSKCICKSCEIDVMQPPLDAYVSFTPKENVYFECPEDDRFSL